MQVFEAGLSLIEQFTCAAIAAAATVQVIDRTPKGLSQAILAVVGAASRILYAPPAELPPDLFADFETDCRIRTDPTPEEFVDSPVGVTEAFAGVASTGSICIDVNHGRTGIVSLLSPLQIAVLAVEKIVAQPRDLFRRDVLEGVDLDRDFVFVTGPSATADMGPLVRGVHGPHRLHIIVLR